MSRVHGLAVAAMVSAGGTKPAPFGWRPPQPILRDPKPQPLTVRQLALLADLPTSLRERVQHVCDVLTSQAAAESLLPAGAFAGDNSQSQPRPRESAGSVPLRFASTLPGSTERRSTSSTHDGSAWLASARPARAYGLTVPQHPTAQSIKRKQIEFDFDFDRD